MTIGPLAAEAASLDVQPATLPSPNDTTLAAALKYIAHGWTVVPVCRAAPGGGCTAAALDAHKGDHGIGKHPTATWKTRAATTTEEAARWWGRRTPYGPNIALLCGPSRVFALDLDGPAGEATLAAAVEVLGPLPPTLVNTTSRGRHLLFALPPSMTEAERAALVGSGASLRLDGRRFVSVRTGEASTGLDVRGPGGIIIVAPSVHESGARYQWTGGALATLPPAWCEALPRTQRPGPKRAVGGVPGEAEAMARIDAATSLPDPRPRASVDLRARYRGVLNKALPRLCREIVDAPDGAQNNTIFTNAKHAYGLAIGAGVDLESITPELLAACELGNHPAQASRLTVDMGRTHAERGGAPSLPERELPERDRRTSAAGRRSTDGAAGAEGETAGQGEEYAPPLPSDGRPRIATGPDLARVVAEAVDALGAHAEVYQRRGVGLVRVLSAPDDSHDPGAPIIDPIPRPVLAAMLSAVARWEGRDRKGNARHVQPPDLVTAAVHANGTFPASVRPLRGIVEAPTLRRDGSLAASQGYDPASALFVHCPNVSLDMPDRPTLADAREAFGRLAELFADFRFAGDAAAQNVARSAVVAAMLSPLAREAVDGPCPAFVFEADGPNAGKTLAASVCGALVTGRVPAVRQHTADDDETAKRIASIAIAGHPVALFDNVRSHVEGGALEAALSAHGAIAARILGRSEDRELPWRTVLFLTMNAASYSADVARRVVHIAMRGRAVDLDASITFKVPDLARHVLARRSDLLRDAFVILRAHQLAGRPHKGATLPTFEAWSRVVAAAVHWASGHDPVRARPPESANRDANIARSVTLAWCAAYPGEPLTIGALRSRLLATYLPGAAGPAASAATGALRDALAELAGAPDVSRVSAGSLGRRVQLHVVGRVYVDPVTGRSVSIEAAGSLHGSARYAATVEAVEAPADAPLPDDHPARGVGECGSEVESTKRPLDETHTERVATPGVVAWDA